MTVIDTVKFIVDNNVAKLAKWLRMMGYDARIFNGEDDADMILMALREERLILTRDREIMKRRVVTTGRVRAILIDGDTPEPQMCQVIDELKLDCQYRPFTLCLECNEPLLERSKQQVAERVPPYVLRTQPQYRECPLCHRIYWRGTHWTAMTRRLEKFLKCQPEKDS